MSIQSEQVKRWRNNTKARIILAMGGCCQICGYDKCSDALELHHVDPTQKEFGFSKIRANPKKAVIILEELKKCVLLCSNCHREIHANLISLPEEYCIVDENIFLAKDKKCKECKQKFSSIGDTKYCSKICAGKVNGRKAKHVRRSPLNGIDIIAELKDMNKSQLARKYGVSEAAIRKRVKRLMA